MAAPLGNKNNAKGKAWTDALKRQLAQYTTDKIAMGTALNEIAKTCIRQAIEGDSMARTEIANRLDGKPKEHIEATFTRSLATEMTDDELAAIASGSRSGDAEAPPSEADPSIVH